MDEDLIIVTRGQWWIDQCTKDLILVLGLSTEYGSVEYARCAMFANRLFFGILEMRVTHFATGRYALVGFWKSLWYKWKFRKVEQIR